MDRTKKYPLARRTMTVRPARMTAVAHRALRPARGERSDLLAIAWTLWRRDDAQCPDHRFISVSEKGNRDGSFYPLPVLGPENRPVVRDLSGGHQPSKECTFKITISPYTLIDQGIVQDWRSGSAQRSARRGSSNVKVVLAPGLLRKLIVPPWSSTIFWGRASPRPVPPGFVVKNGLKIFPVAAAGIPRPESSTSTFRRRSFKRAAPRRTRSGP